ncbi:hypothetical protein, partial [uncultured Desulfovibrio sp.]|uniref:hypothetical protein n=1 Tax=uncultured Desulfovibrio sp. TaxID=167968 RepID=UPI00272DC0B9
MQEIFSFAARAYAKAPAMEAGALHGESRIAALSLRCGTPAPGGRSLIRAAVSDYRFMLITVSSMVST